ncbi:hypothetical protein BGAL_0036g00310 [Botrytis galanthina]|uniref:Uncharacterized protein n=1 Tax=Botrytis galanthina TaxID=278940 RepID=A0A4S8RAC4_9HELO|nr:hypothetical protein BGAL_0036g00310 [Botrytis galanthina]
MEVVQNTKKKMSSPSLTEGLALIESASISIQQSMHHVPLKELEDAKKSFDFYAQVSNDFALANFEDTPENQTSRAAFDAALRKAEEEYESVKSDWDKVTHRNHYIQEAIATFEVPNSLLRKTFEDVAVEQPGVPELQVLSNIGAEAVADVATADLPAVDLPAIDIPTADVAVVDNTPIVEMAAPDLPAVDVAATDLPIIDLPAADPPAADVAVVNMDLDITTTSAPSSQNSVDQPADSSIVVDKIPSDYLQALFGDPKEPTHPTIDRFPATIVKFRDSGGAISHVLASSALIYLLANGTQDQAAKELLTRLERIPQELQDEVGNLILDPVYYYQRYCHKNLPRQLAFGNPVYEHGKIIKVSFQSLWLMQHFERFRHAVTIQLFGCRNACWRTIVTIALPAFREFQNVPRIRLLHYIDSTSSTIGNIRGLDFTILYVYLYEMVNADMITLNDMYQDLQGYLMHRYKLPFDLLKMAEDFDIKDHKPKDQGVALRLNGFDLDTPAGQWQQMFENLYRHLTFKTVDASWYKTGSLVICEKCERALPALFSFDKNVLKNGDNHEDPHPICRMCQLVPTCNGLLATAVNAYVPTTPQDAEEKRKSALEDGDPHKPVAPEDVDLSTWVLPESTGRCHWSAASMQVEQHLRYEATLLSPIHVMRRSPQPQKLPPAQPKLIRSKTFFKEIK